MSSPVIRTLLVDDEPVARRVLREELADLRDIEMIGEAENGFEALESIRTLRPDLVFLDLQMPGLGGFEVISKLEVIGPLPTLVIVTAFDQHAIQAFEAGAIDYLLKPVGNERLMKCVDRVRAIRHNASITGNQMSRLQDVAASQGVPSRPRKIVARAGEEFHLVDSSQVLAFQAEREVVWMITRKQRYLATQPLRQIEEKLAGLNFVRIHRNALVNLDHVAKMAPLSSQRWLLTLSNSQEFTVSKRQASSVHKLLNW